MAFLSRLFKRGDPLAEREEARRRGMRDARRHPLGEFTDPEFQPSYVTEVRARAREQVTEVDRRLAATRTALLERALGEREAILRELGRSDTRPEPPAYANGHSPGHFPGPGSGPVDAFISIAEARVRRAEARRRAVVEESNAGVQRARARIEHLTQEWESALIERDHEVEAVHARAEQLIAAYKGGVLRAHPRKEEIPSLWKGEVIAVAATGGTFAAASGREEIGRILREVEERIEVWHAEVMPRELPAATSHTQLTPPTGPHPPPATDTPAPPPTGRADPPSTHDTGPPPTEATEDTEDTEDTDDTDSPPAGRAGPPSARGTGPPPLRNARPTHSTSPRDVKVDDG